MDLVLSDYNLPGFDAFGALTIVQSSGYDLPLIVISGAIGEATAVDLMRSGAKDVISKGAWSRLLPAIRREFAEAQNRRASRQRVAAAHLLGQLGFILGRSLTAPQALKQAAELTAFSFEALCEIKLNEKYFEINDLSEGISGVEQIVFRETLLARSESLGELVYRRDRPFSKEEIEAAQEVCSRISLALDNARLLHSATQAVVLRDDFLSIASHELKTPLTALRMRVQTHTRRLESEFENHFTADRLRGIFKGDLRQIDRLVKLVDEMLDISKIRAGQLKLYPELFDLAALIRDLIARMKDIADHARVNIAYDGPESILGTWDSGRIEQVITNLITNAIKYGGGTPVKVTASESGSLVTVSVADSGPGISVEGQALLFKRFQRLEPTSAAKGLGLGLYIVRQIVEAHAGNIRIASEPGKGSCFIVTLPR